MRKVKERNDSLNEITKRLKSAEQEFKQNEQISQDLTTRNKQLTNEMKRLKDSIIKIQKEQEQSNWHLTDHVVLRYIERKYNLPIDQVKKEILDIVQGNYLGDSDNCMGFVVKGNSIITYKNKNGISKDVS